MDTCRDHMLTATRLRPSRMPSTVEDIAADLREAAREAGVDLAILTGDAWQADRVDDQRFHLTLYSDGAAVMHGYWPDRATADRKFVAWIGEHGGVANARITLVDTETGRVLTTWPDED